METDIITYEQNSNALRIERAPEQVLSEAKAAAQALGQVLAAKKKPVMMNGEQYLEFEDWQTVGRFYGVTAKVASTEFVDYGTVKGFLARAVAIRSDGMEISAAEAMCLNDEDKWSTRAKYAWVNGKREKTGEEPVPLFQLRSMAQTRACAKALRNVLAWVVVLAGYRATPAEELDGQTDQGKPPIQQPKEKAAPENTSSSGTPNDPSVISVAQSGRFYAIAKGTGASDEAIKTWLNVNFGWTSTKNITKARYDEVCARVVKEIKTEPREPGQDG